MMELHSNSSELKKFAINLIIVVILVCASENAMALKLQEVIESALNLDPTVRISKINQNSSEENIAIARARLLPQIFLQGSSSQITQTTTQELISSGGLSKTFTGPSVNHQLVIRQALIRPKELSSLKYAEMQVEYTERKYKLDIEELKSKVTSLWIDLLTAQEIVKAYERVLPYMKETTIQERIKYKLGESTKDAVKEVDAQYENYRSTLFQAVETLKLRKITFENVTKISSSNLSDKILNIPHLPEFTENEKQIYLEKIINLSIEIEMAKLHENMLLEKVKNMQNDHMPTLDLIAAINLAQNDATSTQGYQYKNKQIGVQYSVPIYSGGAINSGVKQALLGYEGSIAETELTYRRIISEFDNHWSVVVSGKNKETALLLSCGAAEEQLKAVKRGYSLGVKSGADVISSELILARRNVELIINRQEYYKALMKIYKDAWELLE